METIQFKKLAECKPFFRTLILVGGFPLWQKLKACTKKLRNLVERTLATVPAPPALLPTFYAQLDKLFEPVKHSSM